MDDIIDQLVEYSGYLFEIKMDNLLPLIALSRIHYDHRNKPRNEIILNPTKIPMYDRAVLAHVLSHEWGHHLYNHVKIDPANLTSEQRVHIENEADFFASLFVNKYNYNKDSIIKYILESDLDKPYIKSRISILAGDYDVVRKNIDLLDKI